MMKPPEIDFLSCKEFPPEKPIIPVHHIKITAINCYEVGKRIRIDCFVPNTVIATLHFWDPIKKQEFTFEKNTSNTCVFEHKLLDLDYYPGVWP